MTELTDTHKECHKCYKRHCAGENPFPECKRYVGYAKTETGSCMFADMIDTDIPKWRERRFNEVTMFSIVQKLDEEGFLDQENAKTEVID